MKLKNGDIGMSKTHFHLLKPLTWLAWIIRILTKCPYNHVWVVIEIYSKIYIIEVDENGCHLQLAETRIDSTKADYLILRPKKQFSFDDENGRRQTQNFNHAEEIAFVEKALSVAGKVGYGEIDLIFRHLLQLIGLKWKQKPKYYLKTFVCSEFAAWMHEPYFKEFYRMNPKHIYDSKDFLHFSLNTKK